MPYITFQDKKIFYRIGGKGNPVIFIHGFCEDGNIWNMLLDRLTKNYLVIIPDLPGSGKSEMLEGNCLIEDYAEVIKAIADKVIAENIKITFSLIGHSMGGYITLAFAEKYPDLLNSFGLFHSSAFADDEAKIETRKKSIEFIKKNGTEAYLKTSTPNLFSEKTKTEKPELIQQLIQMAKQISAEAMIQYQEAMILRPDRTSVLREFPKPILYIIGKNDTAVPIEASLQQCHIPAISPVHILQNSGHEGMLEEPALSASYLEFFLNNFV